jgi:hypothetical protein
MAFISFFGFNYRAWHQQITAYLNVDPTTALALMGLVEIENDVTP